jgi:hypothetical protein
MNRLESDTLKEVMAGGGMLLLEAEGDRSRPVALPEIWRLLGPHRKSLRDTHSLRHAGLRILLDDSLSFSSSSPADPAEPEPLNALASRVTGFCVYGPAVLYVSLLHYPLLDKLDGFYLNQEWARSVTSGSHCTLV